LVADHVYVASIAAKSSANPNPAQYVFSSTASDSDFELFVDPRGNTLERGTEITLVLKNDALEYLDATKLSELMYVVVK
jgi:heat shock protein beta